MARSVAETRVDRYALEQESRYRSDTMRTHDYIEGVSGDRDHAAEGGQNQGQGYEEAGSRAPYDSQAAFFGQQQEQQQSPQPLVHESAPVSSASPYDGLEALAGLTFNPPAAQSNATAEDPFASAAAQYNTSRASELPSLNPFAPTNPYASLTASSPARGGGGSYEPDSILEGQEASHTTPMIRPVGSPVDEHGVRERSTTDSSIKSSYIPEAPSAKALGKLRRVSVGQSKSSKTASRYHTTKD